ncbi:MAG: cytochrome c [Rhizobiaceae bacterium]|nr:cytochrome c [Rhizobiaceae bacterium]
MRHPRLRAARPFALAALLGAASLIAPSVAVAADPAAGKDKAGMCATCHGLDGIASAPDAPNLAGTSAIYLGEQLKAYRSGARQHPQMSIIAKGLEDADIADLAAWYASIEVTATMPGGN